MKTLNGRFSLYFTFRKWAPMQINVVVIHTVWKYFIFCFILKFKIIYIVLKGCKFYDILLLGQVKLIIFFINQKKTNRVGGLLIAGVGVPDGGVELDKIPQNVPELGRDGHWEGQAVLVAARCHLRAVKRFNWSHGGIINNQVLYYLRFRMKLLISVDSKK